MPDELYCSPGSNVLKNKMGIQDIQQLHEMERKLNMLRILELLDKPVRGAFDLKHLRAIHAHIFQDDFVIRLAYFFSEINALHPFREGNGRSQREFIRCLALHNGYVIYFVNVSKGEMLEVSRESFLCKYGAMERLFRKCLGKR